MSRRDREFLGREGISGLTNQPLTHKITLVIATGNRGKFKEFAELLQGLNADIVPLDRVGPVEVPPESGDSFQENARLKAVAVATALGAGFWLMIPVSRWMRWGVPRVSFRPGSAAQVRPTPNGATCSWTNS